MISNDNQQYITIELFNAKMDTLLTQIQLNNEKLRSELRSEFQSEISALRSDMHTGFLTLQTQTQVNSAKIEMLQHTFYWGLGIMTVVIALITIFVPSLSQHFKQKDKGEKLSEQTLTREDVQDMISQALGGFKPAGK